MSTRAYTYGSMVTSQEQVQLIRDESRRLGEHLEKLPPSAWSHPTACEHWDVATVVAHLAGSADAFAERIQRGVAGDVSPPQGLPDAGAVNAEAWAKTNARRWLDIRAGMGDNLLSRFHTSSERLNMLIAGLSPQQWDTACYHPGGVVPVRTLVGFRLLELAVHGWDIRSRLESPARISDETLPALVEFVSAYIGWFFVPCEKLLRPIRYRFELSGKTADCRDIVVEGHKARMEAAKSSPANTTFRCSTEAFVLLMCGRTRLQDSIAGGQIVFEGNQEVAMKFEEWFRGA
jgi:uncharacterized protein (TIGR03083 family)